MKQQYFYGCTPSKLDGSEHKVDVDTKLPIPEEFTWQDSMPPVRNQGTSSTCVCQTLTGVLDFQHNNKTGATGICNNYPIEELYNCRANKNAEGMSIKEALHYLRHTGLKGEKINSYALAGGIDVLKRALIMFGPCAAGLPVYDANDGIHFWRKRGRLQGGHCITIVGYNKEGFIIRNSWGSSWANKGHVVLPYEEFSEAVFEAWTILL